MFGSPAGTDQGCRAMLESCGTGAQGWVYAAEHIHLYSSRKMGSAFPRA